MTRPWSQVRALRRNVVDVAVAVLEDNVTITTDENGEPRFDLPPAPYTITVTNDCPWTEERVLALQAEVDRLTGLLLDEGYRDGIRLAEAVNEVVGHRIGAERARLAAAVAALPDSDTCGHCIDRGQVLALLEGEG